MSQEHPVEQAIAHIVIRTIHERVGEIEASSIERLAVGYDGVTRIEACEKSGMYSPIPYVRVWAGDQCLAEFCQHNIVGVYFDDAPPIVPIVESPDIDPECVMPHPDGKACRECYSPF